MQTFISLRIISTALLALAAAACSSAPTRLSPADRAAVRSVAVHPQVSLPTKYAAYSYTDLTSGTGQDLAVGGGLLWQAIALATTKSSASSGATLLADSQSHGFPIESVVRDVFTRQFQQSGIFPLAAGGAPDATFKLTIAGYGLAHEGLVRKIIPFVTIQAELLKPDGRVAFTAVKSARAANECHHTFEEFHAAPQLLRAGWEDAARQASDAVCEQLRR